MRRPTKAEIRNIISVEYSSLKENKSPVTHFFASHLLPYPESIQKLIRVLDQFKILENTPLSYKQHQELSIAVRDLSKDDKYHAISENIQSSFPHEIDILSNSFQRTASAIQQLLLRNYWGQRTYIMLGALGELTGKNDLKANQALLSFVSATLIISNLYYGYHTNFRYFIFKSITHSLTEHSQLNKIFSSHLKQQFNFKYTKLIATVFIELAIQYLFDYYYNTNGLFLLTYLTMTLAENFTFYLFQWLDKNKTYSSLKGKHPFTTQFFEFLSTDAISYASSLLTIQLHQYMKTPPQSNTNEKQKSENHDKNQNRKSQQEQRKTKHKQNASQNQGQSHLLTESEKKLLSNDRACHSEPSKCCHAARKFMGLGNTSSKNEIKKEYRKLSLLFHPDKCEKPGCEENFVLLNQARDAALSKCL